MEDRVVSIYQPNYLPPMHYIGRILQSDVFVLLDDVQLNRRVGQTRAYVGGSNGKVMLSVPILGGSRVMLDEALCADTGWQEQHIKTLKGLYGYKESNAIKWIDWVSSHISDHRYRDKFSVLCSNMLKDVLEYLGWEGRYVVATEDTLVIESKGVDPSKRMLEITKQMGGTTYLCGGEAAENYLNTFDFEHNGVAIEVQNWKPIEYEQRSKKFLPNLSIIDGLIMLSQEELKKMFKGGL